MSRPRMLHKQFYVNFTPQEWAQVVYYAWKYNKDRREIVRGMVGRYVEADKRFDAREFLAFIKKDIRAFFTDEDDSAFRREGRRQAERLVTGRGAR